MKKIFIALIIISSVNLYAAPMSCRDAVVKAYENFGETIDPNSFSSKKFVDLKISVKKFNELTAENQVEHYEQLMPMKVKVANTLKEINYELGEYSIGFMAMLYPEAVSKLRESKEKLTNCIITPL